MRERPSRPASPLPVVCASLAASSALVSALAWLLAPRRAATDPPGAFALWTLVACALAALIVAAALERALPAAAAESNGDIERARVRATIAAFALREATALLGALVTFLTGQRIFVAMLGGFALLAMLVAWPEAPARDSIDPG